MRRHVGRLAHSGVALAAVASMTVIMSVVPGTKSVPAEALLEVSISTVGDVFFTLPAEHEIAVSNLGSEPLTGVSVAVLGSTPDQPLQRGLPESLTGPTIVEGNDDDVLDPGERWLYRCQSDVRPGTIEASVTAVTPSGEVVEVSDVIEHTDGDLTSAPARFNFEHPRVAIRGDTLDWQVRMTNATSSPIEFEAPILGQLYAVVPESFPLATAVSDQRELLLVRQGENGDDSWDPGETWEWAYSEVVMIDGSSLRVFIDFLTWDGYRAGWTSRSGEVSLGPTPTTSAPTSSATPGSPAVSVPPGPLPPTGAGQAGSIGIVGVVIGLGGVLLVLSVLHTRRAQAAAANGSDGVGPITQRGEAR